VRSQRRQETRSTWRWIDVDEGVGIAIVPAAGNDAEAPLDHAPDDVKVFVARPDRRRLAAGMRLAARRQPTGAVQATLGAA
jgi:hypothetical protein